MASGDDKLEEEEFEDLPSDVEGDASEVRTPQPKRNLTISRRLPKKAPRTTVRKARKRSRRKRKKRKRRKRTASKKRRKRGRKKKRREEREHLHLLHHHPHHPHHHLHLVRMEMGMMSTTVQEFPREHSNPSQSPRISPRMTIKAYPLTMIPWKQNLRMISLYPLASYPNLMGLILPNGST
jgi:hypothetical protein